VRPSMLLTHAQAASFAIVLIVIVPTLAALCSYCCMCLLRSQLWGLATHPRFSVAVTVGDDNLVALWDLDSGRIQNKRYACERV
jgi:hypothetical protein